MTVCSFFLQGRCRYGEKCWNEHPSGGGGGRGGGGGGRGGGGRGGYTNRVWVNPQVQNLGGDYVKPSSFSRGGNEWGRGGGGGGDVKNFSFSSQNRFSALNSQNSFDRRGSSPAEDNEKHLEAIQKDMEAWQSSGQWAFSCYSVLNGSITGFMDLSPEELRLEYYNSRASGDLQSYANSVQQLANQWRSRVQELRIMGSSTRVAMISELSNPRSQSSAGGGSFSSSSAGFGSSSSSGFGAGGFGSGAPQSSAGFSFASSGPGFGPQSSQPASSGFGPQSSQPASSGFGSGPSQPASSGFGSGPSQPASSGFGSGPSQAGAAGFVGFGSAGPSSTPSASSFSFTSLEVSRASPGGFGSPAGFSFTSSTVAPTGGFGSSTPAGGSGLFGQTSAGGLAGASGENEFTPQSELTQEELREFTSKRFTLGQIPLRPPPAELLTV